MLLRAFCRFHGQSPSSQDAAHWLLPLPRLPASHKAALSLQPGWKGTFLLGLLGPSKKSHKSSITPPNAQKLETNRI